MKTSQSRKVATAMALVLAAATVVEATGAAAQYSSSADQYGPQNGPPPGQFPPPPSQAQGYGAQPGEPAPPQGQYAPPPPGAESSGAVYDYNAQRYDYDYGRRYSQWAARYCVERRSDNAAAGAIIGGVLGAVLGSGLSGRGDHGAGMVVGGALGATTGALIGASSSAPGGCPPGYVLSGGAPAFYYQGPASAVFWAPSWYNPWVFVGGTWVYHPYRYWYFNHGGYWRPGWRPGPFVYRYRRW